MNNKQAKSQLKGNTTRLEALANNCFDTNPQVKFIMNAVNTAIYKPSPYMTDWARAFNHKANARSQLDYFYRNLKTINNKKLKTLTLGQVMPHLKNNAFYLIVDVSAVEKAYTKFSLTNGLESLSYVHDGRKKESVKGYHLATILAVTENNDIFVLWSNLYSMNKGFNLNFKELNSSLCYVIRNLKNYNKPVHIVVAMDNINSGMVLITNIKINDKNNTTKCFFNYLKQWLIENFFTLIKNVKTYRIEKMLIRSINKMNNFLAIIFFAINTISIAMKRAIEFTNFILYYKDEFTTSDSKVRLFRAIINIPLLLRNIKC